MSIVFLGIVPHPPIMVPEVGGSEARAVKETQDALQELGQRIVNSGAETLVIISPHGPVFRDAVGLNVAVRAQGNLGRFQAPEVDFDLETDQELAATIAMLSRNRDLLIASLEEQSARRYGGAELLKLDHGVTAPLYWLWKAGVNTRLLEAGMSFLPPKKLYTFGQLVREAADELGRKVALLASGDLSHRITPDAPGGYSPQGAEFDAEIVKLIKGADSRGIVDIDRDLAEEAGECGLRPIIMMLGALDGYAWEGEVLSYEAPFGVGYMVAELRPREKTDEAALDETLQEEYRQAQSEHRQQESYLVHIARQRLENYIRGVRKMPDLGEVPTDFRKPGGVFVSIKKDGMLRGCIGTILPTKDSVVEEVLDNAVSAGTRDPRFFPVRPEELNELDYSVDVLGEPEPVSGIDELDPKRYGVIVSRGRQVGLLLPDLEGIDTAEEQVEIARQKAGIAPGAKVKLERFLVTRYK
ncbi:MAG: AmmeMemoRadiSam system protein A [Candidatus Desulforudaceae bacterium]